MIFLNNTLYNGLVYNNGNKSLPNCNEIQRLPGLVYGGYVKGVEAQIVDANGALSL
jgi:hypothetical protein